MRELAHARPLRPGVRFFVRFFHNSCISPSRGAELEFSSMAASATYQPALFFRCRPPGPDAFAASPPKP